MIIINSEPDLDTEQDTFSKEVQLYISGGERTSSLIKLHNDLKSVPPTSVEAERVFSVTGLFISFVKIRNYRI